MSAKRTCSKCGEEQVIEEFRLRKGKRGKLKHRTSLCMECERTRARNNYHKNKDRTRKLKYGMEPGEFDSRLEAQEGKCAVCGGDLDDLIVVEHDHKTGKVRGLTHQKCNMILGLAGDSVELLRKAITYLEEST